MGEAKLTNLRQKLHIILFDVNTGLGRFFNITLLLLILLVVVASMIKTVAGIAHEWVVLIEGLEYWVLMIFAVEYTLRVYAAKNRWHYIRSFNGVIDLITVLPLFLTGSSFVLIRLLRLMRVIRVAVSIPVVRSLFASLQGSIRLLLGVLMSIGLISVLVGNIIYTLEPETFANAFEGVWWSLVTMSTVGYGDLVPHTSAGRMVASLLILSGICMFAMVTAVISVKVGRMVNSMAQCRNCQHRIAEDYLYCPHCAAPQDQEDERVSLDDDF
ncbi:MAG: ion transporter [Mariprofundus sp.]|nr:ion transporter [Mariprofundus sp.]